MYPVAGPGLYSTFFFFFFRITAELSLICILFNSLLGVCVCVGSARSAFVHGQGFVVTSGFSLCRVLLRVRMLYYLKQEVIGSEAQKVLDGVDSR